MSKGVKTSAVHEISCYVIFIYHREAAVELSFSNERSALRKVINTGCV